MTAENLVMFLHNLATATWIGGMIFLAFLGAEVEKLGPNFNVVMGKMSRRFSQLALLSILTLIVTGILLTSWHGGTGRVRRDLVLNLKHLAILLVIADGAFLSLKVVPQLEKLTAEKSPEAAIWQRKLKIGSRVNLVLGILIVLLATL